MQKELFPDPMRVERWILIPPKGMSLYLQENRVCLEFSKGREKQATQWLRDQAELFEKVTGTR